MSRLEQPGSLYHIMAHSIEGKPLFVDDLDRTEFLRRLEKGIEKTGFLCYTWALMDNHYHLFLRTNELPMSKLMRGLNGGYASFYNKRHKKHGYLFQDRFKSVLCQQLDYALELIKYINLNPLRAGIVNSLEELKKFPWCGHGFLLGEYNAYGKTFQKREECLRRFGDNEQDAITAYLKYLSESCAIAHGVAGQLTSIEATELKGSCKGWPAVIGTPEFVKQALENYKYHLNRKYRKADYPYVLETVSKKICTRFGITIAELKKRGRKNTRSEARAAFCYQLHIKELVPLSNIAAYLCTTISPIAVLVRKGEAISDTVPV
jgi:REP element-mobilizing transposase RayT